MSNGRTTILSSRRRFLREAGGGLGTVALASMLGTERLPARESLSGEVSARTHFAPKAKRVIYLFMHGGPSHVDLWDPKPDLETYHGQPLPESFGSVMTRRDVANNSLMAPVKPFRKRGQSGLEISDFLPEMSTVADEFAVLRGCHGDSVNHPQSVYQMNTGSILMGRPSVGAWAAYGLGSENQNMPAFVVLPDPTSGPKGGPPAWGNGFLPSTYQGTTMRPGPNPILNLQPQYAAQETRLRATRDLLRGLNASHAENRMNEDELDARIRAYELAFRMQTEAPELVDLSAESEATHRLYGADREPTREFGERLMLARRMVERGVRFVQVYSGGTNGWDAHNNVLWNHSKYCAATDRPVAGLLKDLKSRGLLEDTLVIWGGEFGRMPMNERGFGRDHNPWGYSVVMAGAGIRGGMAHGATDAIGLRAQEGKVHVHDLHATWLHLLGLDHERLTYFHNGRDHRLTDVSGRVVREILAS